MPTKSSKVTLRQQFTGKNAAVAVAIVNPFDDKQKLIWGLPFSEQDKQNAVDFVRRTWPNQQIELQPAEQSGLHLERFVAPSIKQVQVQMPQKLNPYGTGLDALMAKKQQQNYMIRKTYAQRSNKSSKKRGR